MGAGGYGHGSSSMGKWIQYNLEKDRAVGSVLFPPLFGDPPQVVTMDMVDLPFGYGQGSGSATWLSRFMARMTASIRRTMWDLLAPPSRCEGQYAHNSCTRTTAPNAGSAWWVLLRP